MSVRWHATVYYRSAALGTIDVHHELEEIGDIQDIIERGPHWDTVEEVEITIRRIPEAAKLTLEEAVKL